MSSQGKRTSRNLTATHSAKSYDEFLEILREHERETSTKYVLMTGVKLFQQKEVSVNDKQKIHWMENIPYFYYGCRIFACHQGKDTNISKKRKYAMERNLKASGDKSVKPFVGHRETKKLNCPVLISVKRVLKIMIRHPEYPCLERHPKSHMKRVYTVLIRERLNKGKLVCEELYIFNLPKPEDHKYHFVGEEALARALSSLGKKKKKKSSPYCCICKHVYVGSNRNEHVSYHRVPKSEPLLSEWRRIIGRNVKSDVHRVCSLHFHPTSFKKDIMENGKIRKILLPNSVPRVEKYIHNDVVECQEPVVTEEETVEETDPRGGVVPLEHLYCALETTEQTHEEGELYYEEVEVAVEDFQMTCVDDINLCGIRHYVQTNNKSVPENTEESIQDYVKESNPENTGEVSYFEISIPENTEDVEQEYYEESVLQENEEDEYIVETLEENDNQEQQVFESQKHKRRKVKFSLTNENYQLSSENHSTKNNITEAPEQIFMLRQPLNQINKKEHSLTTSNQSEDPKKSNFKNDEELTPDCFTNPEYFQIYKSHKKKLKTEVTQLKSELLEIQSKYAQLNSFVTQMEEQGIVRDCPTEKYLTPLMCSIMDRALLGNKLRVSPELKKFSLALMAQSPESYELVKSELMNALPEEKTIKWWQRKAKMEEKEETDDKPRIFVVKTRAPKLV